MLILFQLAMYVAISQVEIKQSVYSGREGNYIYIQKDSVTRIYDPLDTATGAQRTNNDFAFLFSDTVFYDCKVRGIDEFNEGYGFNVESKIDGIPVWGYIVTAKNKSTKGKKIKSGNRHSYKLKLIRYFEKPLIRPIERRPIYDVLLDTSVIGVLSTGSFCYLFVSPSIDGLTYIEPEKADSIENVKRQKEKELLPFIRDFITSISNINDSALAVNYIDTVILLNLLKKYSGICPSGGMNAKLIRPPREIIPRNWSNFKFDDSKCNLLFWSVLHYFYKLPKENTFFADKEAFLNSIKIKVLYCTADIATVRVKWSIAKQKNEYVAELSIKGSLGNYKVVGFNISNRFY
jgi:hypothetical protein